MAQTVRNTSGLKRDAGPGRPKGSKNKITREWVEQHLRWRVDFDPTVFAEKMGKGRDPVWTLKEISHFPKHVAMCIESYDVVLGNRDKSDGALETVMKIRWYPKDKPLELCARSLGMLKDKLEVTTSDELIDRLDRAKKRARSTA